MGDRTWKFGVVVTTSTNNKKLLALPDLAQRQACHAEAAVIDGTRERQNNIRTYLLGHSENLKLKKCIHQKKKKRGVFLGFPHTIVSSYHSRTGHPLLGIAE